MGMHLNLRAGRKVSFDCETIEKDRHPLVSLILGPKKYLKYEGLIKHPTGETTPVRAFRKINGQWIDRAPEQLGDPAIIIEFQIAVVNRGF